MISFTRESVLVAAARAHLLVLDIDGVLLDARPSFYRAARETALWAAARALGKEAGALPAQDDVRAFKDVGGWNDDFDLAAGLAWAVVLRETRHMPIASTARRSAGGLPTLFEAVHALVPPATIAAMRSPEVRQRSAARYAGRAHCAELYGIDPERFPDLPEEGLFADERQLASASLLRSCALDLALFTGRNRAETRLALERYGLAVPEERCVVDDGVLPRKPAPDGLLHLARYASSGPLIYVGDAVDDQNSVLAYRALAAERPLPEIIFVRVTDGAAPSNEWMADHGVDVTVDGLDAWLEALPRGENT